MKRFITRVLLGTTALIASTGGALAQSSIPAPIPPANYVLDANGVDLATGTFTMSSADVTIGPPPGQGGLSYGLIVGMYGLTDTFDVFVISSDGDIYVTIGNTTDRMRRVGGTYVSVYGRGSSLTVTTEPDGTPLYNYKASSGVVVQTSGLYTPNQITNITYPSGDKTYYNYEVGTVATEVCNDPPTDIQQVCLNPSYTYRYYRRLRSVVTNRGYMVVFRYGYEPNGVNDPNNGLWSSRISATAVNYQVTPCDQFGGPDCTAVPSAHTSTYGLTAPNTTVATNAAGGTARYRYDNPGHLLGVQTPASAVEDIVLAYDANGRVQSLTRPSGAWAYAYSSSGNLLTTTITDPTNRTRTTTVDTTIARATSDKVAGRTDTYSYDAQGLLKTHTAPEGNNEQYNYDANGNSIQTIVNSKSGSASISTSATYYGDCGNYPARCNQPLTTTDARGGVTDYTVDTDGSPLSIVQPTPSVGQPRPTTNFSYTTLNAIGGGTLRLLSSTTQAAGTAEATTTTLGYNGATNLQPTSVTRGAGSLLATVTLSHTPQGDVDTSSGPMPGMVTRNYYDGLRRVVGVVGPDPYGNGKHQASQTMYDANGRVTSQQQGTTANQGDSAGSSFVALATTTNGYDTVGRLTSTIVAGSATASSMTYGYDAANRPLTTTVLMSGQGPNRTTTNGYDGNGLLSTVTTASGTADASTITYGYTGNGKLASIQDGNLNTTNYAYDGFDRAQTTTYADNSTEVLGYDAASNVTSQQRRDGQIINYTYDTVNQVKTRSGAGLSNSYGYDMLGHLTSATGGSYDVSRTYDALGNLLTDTTGGFAMLNDFDAAGRRTGEHWATTGGWIKFQYSPTSAMIAITDASGSNWVSFTYDDLGRRTNLAYLNGRSTAYTFGPDLRLASLTHHMAGGPGTGTQNDVSYSFGYNLAGQITARSTTNDSYVFAPTPRDASVTPNALNQLSPSTSFTYDARGNQTATAAAPARASSFRIDDLPLSVGVSGRSPDILGYDALDRLASIQVGSGGPLTRLVWDENELAGELDGSGNLQGLYARSGSDEPIVWWTPSAVHVFNADDRGSIVALTDLSGNVERIHTYDAYGREGVAAHLGRFGYTGQVALPEAGLVHMRARVYDPVLGRFISADPIGTAGGINLYGYAGGDPVNNIDPSGLCVQASDDNAGHVTFTQVSAGPCGGGGGGGVIGGGVIGGGGGGFGDGGVSTPSIGGGTSGTGQTTKTPTYYISDMPCTRQQRSAAAGGQLLSDVGATVTGGSLALGVASTALGFGGAVTGFLPAAVAGAAGDSIAAVGLTYGSEYSAIGAALQFYGGNSTKYIVRQFNNALVRSLPVGIVAGGLIKQVLKRAEMAVPDLKICR